MQPEAQRYLYDIEEAVRLIGTFTASKTFADYESDVMLRSAVERQFETIGETLSQLARLDEGLAGRITEYRRIIAFRNIIAQSRCHCRRVLEFGFFSACGFTVHPRRSDATAEPLFDHGFSVTDCGPQEPSSSEI